MKTDPEQMSDCIALAPGARAPEFALAKKPGRDIALSDFSGKSIVLVFYPADWSPVCGSELSLFNELIPTFDEFNAQVLGISVDGAWCHAAFASERNIIFPLLSDFEPKGAVAKAYGVYRTRDGTAERALFVIDGSGIIRWSYISPIDIVPGADGVLNTLASIAPQTKEKAL